MLAIGVIGCFDENLSRRGVQLGANKKIGASLGRSGAADRLAPCALTEYLAEYTTVPNMLY